VKPRRFDLDDSPCITARCDVRVRFQEVDALGMVWHGHYLTYCEEGRNAFGRRHGFAYQDIQRHGYVAPIVHFELDYLHPARFDELLQVTTHLHATAGARIDFTYLIADAAGKPLAHAHSVQAFTDHDGALVLVRPAFFEALLARWQPEMVRR
jgi:acyl-CoA thioester hydrolase